MQYIIKSGDTLSKIAAKHSIPLAAILTLNPQITNPNHLFIGQIIRLPNTDDIPEGVEFSHPTPVNNLIVRARSVVNKPILYKLGAGGMVPNDALPSRNGLCDCSGFICWVLGLSRQTSIPFYKKLGGWIYTDAMVSDIESTAGIFEKINLPEPGCIVVYGAGKAIGHVGIVSEVKAGSMTKVIHCSSGNSKKFNAAIQETAPTVFNRADTVWGRFTG